MIDTDRRLFAFDNTYAEALPELVAEWSADDVPEPELVVLNTELAATLTDEAALLAEPAGIAVLAGNEVPAGAEPVAMVYAGHQFGHYSPRLGDGRALLLGEVIDGGGRRVDLHLKGSGRTPFARGGDGKATLGPMLREYLIAEAMHGLTIPTSRALAVVTTGEQIMRQGLEPGAVLTRVAHSHLRVGTFEYAARLDDRTVLKRLADYAIDRHFPDLNSAAGRADDGEGRYLALLRSVVEVQASLVARWMLVGFIHGVMNTDNMTISGETIDYGPCAFMDRYHSSTVYSSIDHQGRYAYGNQPAIAQWNLSRLAETLLPLMADDAGVEPDAMVPAATDILEGFTERLRAAWADGMRQKLGLEHGSETDSQLFSGLLELLQTEGLDYTSFFRTLARSLRPEGGEAAVAHENLEALVEHGDRLDDWLSLWQGRLEAEGRDPATVAAAMDAVNPIYIPRNHLVEEALKAAQDGDLEPFNQLLAVVTDPFTERTGLGRYAEPAPDSFTRGYQTFCGT